MRIILITTKLNFVSAGGSVFDLHNKACGLAELGNQVTVVTAYSHRNDFDPFGLPYTVKEEQLHSRGLLGNQAGVYRILKKYEHKADAFYVDGQVFVYGAGLYRWLGGQVPVLSFFNIRLNCWADMFGNIPEDELSVKKLWKKKLRRFLEHWLGVRIANKNDAFVFNTPHVEKMYGEWGFDLAKSTIVEDCIDTGTVIAREQYTLEKIKKHQSNPDPFVIYTTGRIFPEKGFDIVIKAFSKLPDKEKYRVTISGTGPDEGRLHKMVEDLRLQKYIEFPGWVDKKQLAEYFSTSHVFIFPKWWIEYGSAVLTEAMAYGLPCIIPGKGALEWLTQGTAMTYEMDNVDDLAEKIKLLASDTDLRIKHAQKILHRAAELDYKNLVQKLNHVMKLIVKK